MLVFDEPVKRESDESEAAYGLAGHRDPAQTHSCFRSAIVAFPFPSHLMNSISD